MTDYQIRRTDTSTELVYEFELIQSLRDNGNIPFTSVEADDPVRNQQVSFSGKQRTVTLEFILYDNGEDKSQGSLASSSITDNRFSNDTVTSVREQKIWLEEYIQASRLGASWVFTDGAIDVEYSDPDGDGALEYTPVVIPDLSVQRNSSNLQAARGSITLNLGQRV